MLYWETNSRTNKTHNFLYIYWNRNVCETQDTSSRNSCDNTRWYICLFSPICNLPFHTERWHFLNSNRFCITIEVRKRAIYPLTRPMLPKWFRSVPWWWRPAWCGWTWASICRSSLRRSCSRCPWPSCGTIARCTRLPSVRSRAGTPGKIPSSSGRRRCRGSRTRSVWVRPKIQYQNKIQLRCVC